MGLKVRNPRYRAAIGVTEAVAGNDLRALVKAGLLEAHGEKRGRFYLATPQVSAIRARTREPRGFSDPFANPDVLKRSPANLVLPGMGMPAR
jgi:hypothetical protein